ncbi:STAS domain-containing protein [Planococcus beigongshangi]|uniref:STAS domain-containing protein n=1 Tax=Planococcus beigongshangi TaxID=2782536 RepID=UPI00193B74CF|nr:STAS domain-containing protein [Planococcus beigongshangi]
MNSTDLFAGWPLPAFQLTNELDIVASSEAAQNMFGKASSILEILDEGSAAKAEMFLTDAGSNGPVELDFKGNDGVTKLCDLYWKTAGETDLIVTAVPKDKGISKISAQLTSLRSRLSDTNYNLLLEKERTERLLQRVRELSAPTIELGYGHLLIPFFGDLDSGKIESIQNHILKDVYEKHAETVILDLTAMDQISLEGMNYLESLLETFKIMGTESIITGVKPEHAKQLNGLKSTINLNFESSLAAVLSDRRLTHKTSDI